MLKYNIKETYVNEDEQWLDILAAAKFTIRSMENLLKVYIPGQLVFGRDIIIPIKHTVGWLLICQRKQTKINKYNIRKNNIIIDHA